MALVAEAFTVKARVLRDNAQLESEKLEFQLKSMETQQAMVRMGADILLEANARELRQLPSPTSLDIWTGDEEPPELEAVR